MDPKNGTWIGCFPLLTSGLQGMLVFRGVKVYLARLLHVSFIRLQLPPSRVGLGSLTSEDVVGAPGASLHLHTGTMLQKVTWKKSRPCHFQLQPGSPAA